MEPEMIGLGVVQMEPVLGDPSENRRRSTEAIYRAVNLAARIIVLPELCSSGYAFNSQEELLRSAETIPGPTTRAWEAVAREAECIIVGGIAERADNNLYNSAVTLGPRGVLSVYRKLHLFDREQLLFQPGNLGLPVVDLPFGRMGTLICYDLRFPEVTRILAIQGADLIAVPTNWVPAFNRNSGNGELHDVDGHCPQGRTMQALAGLNQVFMAAADRVGMERELTFLGASLVVDPWGTAIAGPLSPDAPDVAVCLIDLAEAQRARLRGERIQPYAERRTDVYADFLGYDPERYSAAQ